VQELKDPKAQQGLKDQQELKDRLELLAQQELKVHRGCPG
jgi:hypothetical protein